MNDEAYNHFRIAVPPGFAAVFSHFYFAENNSGESIARTLLPSFQTILIFSFDAPALLHSGSNTQIAVDKCIVLGTVKKAFRYELPPKAKILVANFKDDGFYRLFGSALFPGNLPVNPDKLLEENCFTALWYELDKIREPHRQVEYMLAFCQPYLAEQNKLAERLSQFKSQSLSPIKAVAMDVKRSERSIQISYKKYFGYSAKEVSRYHRFLKAVEMAGNMAGKSSKEAWFDIIGDCGYYDQSQLINDFKHYLNLTPAKYLRFLRDICNPAS